MMVIDSRKHPHYPQGGNFHHLDGEKKFVLIIGHLKGLTS